MTLEPDEAMELVEQIAPRPGWTLTLHHNPGSITHYRLVIRAWVKNTRYEANPSRQQKDVELYMPRDMPLGADKDEETLLSWVLYEYLWLCMHEEMEWFRDKNTKLPILDPHASSLTANRLLPPRPGEEWWRPQMLPLLAVHVTSQTATVTSTSSNTEWWREGRVHEGGANPGV